MSNREWRFLDGQETGSVSLQPTFEINDAAAAIRAAQLGHGVTTALSCMVADQIRDGTLATVLEDFAPRLQDALENLR